METANLRVRVECSAAESTGQLRVLTEDTDLIPSTHMSQLSIISPQISNALSSGLCRHQAHTVDTDAQTTHEIINKNRVIWKRGKKYGWKPWNRRQEGWLQNISQHSAISYPWGVRLKSPLRRVSTELPHSTAQLPHFLSSDKSVNFPLTCFCFFFWTLIKSLSMFSLHSGLFLLLWSPLPLPLKSSLWTDIARYASFCNP